MKKHWQPAAPGLTEWEGLVPVPANWGPWRPSPPISVSTSSSAVTRRVPAPSSLPCHHFSLSTAKLVSPQQFFYPVQGDGPERTLLRGWRGGLGSNPPIASQLRDFMQVIEPVGALGQCGLGGTTWHLEIWGQLSLSLLRWS